MLIWNGSAFAQSKCQKVREGSFAIYDGGTLVTVVFRYDSTQVELMGPIETTTKVTWTDDCNYRLSFVSANDAYYEAFGTNTPRKDLLVHITKVKRKGYKFEAVREGETYVLKGYFKEFKGI